MKESATSIASAAITIFLTGCIIIAHDVSDDFKQSLVALTGHHWLSVSVIAMVLFVLSSGLLLGSKSAKKIHEDVRCRAVVDCPDDRDSDHDTGNLRSVNLSISSGLRFIHRIKSGVKNLTVVGFSSGKLFFGLRIKRDDGVIIDQINKRA